MWFSKPSAKVVKILVLHNTYFVVYYYFALITK
jgi:hypothetical protein